MFGGIGGPQTPPQDRPLRGQPAAAGVREREPVLARGAHRQDGAERAAALQLHRDRAERVGGRGRPHVAGRGQRDRREGPGAQALQEAVRQSATAQHPEARRRGGRPRRHPVLGQPAIQAYSLEDQAGPRGMQRALLAKGQGLLRTVIGSL